VDGVGEADARGAGERRAGAGSGWETHWIGQVKGMKAWRTVKSGRKLRELGFRWKGLLGEKEERSASPRGTDLEEKLRSEWRGKGWVCKKCVGNYYRESGLQSRFGFYDARKKPSSDTKLPEYPTLFVKIVTEAITQPLKEGGSKDKCINK